jgi:hypothetical protein
VLGHFTRHASFLARLQDLHARVPEDEKRAVDSPVRAGSVILFHSMLLHASNRNIDDLERPAYIPSYMDIPRHFWLFNERTLGQLLARFFSERNPLLLALFTALDMVSIALGRNTSNIWVVARKRA